MKNFDDRPLSYRLARALLWLDSSMEERRAVIQVLEEVGENASDEDLPMEYQELLRRASRMAPRMTD